jgi:sec-independent protein translocase protein TatC
VFELPVVIFLLTLLHLLSPRFLLRHSRYAILAIVIAAAIITPTPDVFNLMLFAIPMCLLYFVGVFAGLVLVMRREGRIVPWRTIIWIAVIVVLIAAAIAFAMIHFHIHFMPRWPYFAK